jgi:TusA-related sulfurtransferase
MSKISASPAGPADLPADRTLDITGQICPMTFVRTRLALDCMQPGQTLLVLLRGDEPRRNVPATAAAQGHAVLAQQDGADGITRLWLRRG